MKSKCSSRYAWVFSRSTTESDYKRKKDRKAGKRTGQEREKDREGGKAKKVRERRQEGQEKGEGDGVENKG